MQIIVAIIFIIGAVYNRDDLIKTFHQLGWGGIIPICVLGIVAALFFVNKIFGDTRR